jgi:hypothetical protein
MGAILANMGYLTWGEFIYKFILPISATCAVASWAVFYMIENYGEAIPIPWHLPYIIIVLGIGFMALYPYILFEHKRIDIKNNMHYFITYLGSIAPLVNFSVAMLPR